MSPKRGAPVPNGSSRQMLITAVRNHRKLREHPRFRGKSPDHCHGILRGLNRDDLSRLLTELGTT